MACGLARDVSLHPVSHPHIQPTITSKGKHDVEEDEESRDDCEDSAPSRLVWVCKRAQAMLASTSTPPMDARILQCWILSLGPHDD